MVYVGLEVGFGGYIYSYAVKVNLRGLCLHNNGIFIQLLDFFSTVHCNFRRTVLLC
jgi:hypothetical protein